MGYMEDQVLFRGVFVAGGGVVGVCPFLPFLLRFSGMQRWMSMDIKFAGMVIGGEDDYNR